MNNTKWNEIFHTFYQNECTGTGTPIRWRMRDKESGFISNWDWTWTHFGCDSADWKHIDYLQIELTGENREYVLEQLRAIHVPGIVDDQTVTVYGYRQDIDYIR